MKKLLTAFAAIILFASCQKEISLNSSNSLGNGSGSGTGGSGGGTGSGGSSTGSGLLIKTVAVTGSETITTVYSYDGNNRLYTQTDNGSSGGYPVNSYKRFERDAAGRIVQTVQKLGDIGGATSDTARVNYHYPNATTMDPDYSVSVQSIGAGGFTLSNIDSSVYNYNGGKLVSYNGYMFTEILGALTPLSEKRWDYGYNSSGYVSAMKAFTNTNTGDPLTETYNIAFTYGTQANNAYASANPMQNFIIYAVPSPGNTPAATKSVANTVRITPPVQVTITTSFTTSGSKITNATANVVSSGGPNQTTNYTFYYQ